MVLTRRQANASQSKASTGCYPEVAWCADPTTLLCRFCLMEPRYMVMQTQ
jgi:hypothetical protein